MNSKNKRNHSTSTAKYFNMMQFLDKYHNNPDACRDTMIQLRFPNGWKCPECGCTEYRWLKTRNCMQCKCCYHQTHVLAGTIFQRSHLSFFQILMGIFCFVISQSGISGTTLALYMGTNVSTARLFLRKLRKACELGNQETWLKNAVQLDGSYFGGVDEGGKRGLGSNKQTVMVSVEVEQGKNKYGNTVLYPRQSTI